MGSYVWVVFMLVILELLLIYKMAPDDIPSAPWINKVAWVFAFVLYGICSFVMLKKWEVCDHNDNNDQKERTGKAKTMTDSHWVSVNKTGASDVSNK